MSRRSLVAVGDIFIDYVCDLVDAVGMADWVPARSDFQTAARVETEVGGAGVQFCAAAADLAYWDEVTLIGKVGGVDGERDADGLAAVAELQGRVTTLLAHDPGTPTGRVVVAYLPGDRRFMVSDVGANGTFAPRDLSPQMRDAVRDAEYLHVSGYALVQPGRRRAALALMRSAHRAGTAVALDLAPHTIDAVVDVDLVLDEILPVVDVLFAATPTAIRTFGPRLGVHGEPEVGAALAERCDAVVLFPHPARARYHRRRAEPETRSFDYRAGPSSRGQSARAQAVFLRDLSWAGQRRPDERRAHSGRG